MLKIFNNKILFINDKSYYITNRNNTYQFIVFQTGR